jgi:serine protease inhibitor
MPVKSKSRTFKPGEDWWDIIQWVENETWGLLKSTVKSDERKVKKRLVITITYERDTEK